MSVFLTADLQLHNHSSFGTLLPTGFSNRLQDGINALDQILAVAKKGDTIVVLGDLFETQRAVDTSVMYAVSEWVGRARAKGVKLILVAGNHDHYSRSGTIHALKPFELLDNVTVVPESAVLTIDGNQYVFFAYTDDTDALKERLEHTVAALGPKDAGKRFLCLHQGVSGAMLASSLFEGALGLEDLHLDKFDHVFLGHFHKPQSLADTVTYLGSPYQVTSDESGDVKRFIKIASKGAIESIRTTGNQFHYLAFPELEQAVRLEPGYYKVRCSTSHQADRVAELARTHNIKAQAVFERDSSAPSKHATAAAMNWDDAVRDWLSAKGRPDLTDEALNRLRTVNNQPVS